jgi:hypothetical protein
VLAGVIGAALGWLIRFENQFIMATWSSFALEDEKSEVWRCFGKLVAVSGIDLGGGGGEGLPDRIYGIV